MNQTKYDGDQVVSWDKCGWKPAVEKSPSKLLKLSALIREGHALNPEGKLLTVGLLNGLPCPTCAIGAALAATRFGSDRYEAPTHDEARHYLKSKGCDVPLNILLHASDLHFTGKANRIGVADWLEAQGY